MVDAARQMLDELMGRNRNLHPSEASHKLNWDDPDVSRNKEKSLKNLYLIQKYINITSRTNIVLIIIWCKLDVSCA